MINQRKNQRKILSQKKSGKKNNFIYIQRQTDIASGTLKIKNPLWKNYGSKTKTGKKL